MLLSLFVISIASLCEPSEGFDDVQHARALKIQEDLASLNWSSDRFAKMVNRGRLFAGIAHPHAASLHLQMMAQRGTDKLQQISINYPFYAYLLLKARDDRTELDAVIIRARDDDGLVDYGERNPDKSSDHWTALVGALSHYVHYWFFVEHKEQPFRLRIREVVVPRVQKHLERLGYLVDETPEVQSRREGAVTYYVDVRR